MLLILDTSHSPINLCGLLWQSPLGDNVRHALTAPLISGLDCGENAGVGHDGVDWDRGEAVSLSYNFWDIYNKGTSGLGFGREGCAFVHAPPLQEFGDMLTRSVRNRIQRHDGKRLCAC